ncbi:hypothetical protein KL864_33845 [Mycolicibacterium goodii]|uniref:hypothetical protein n=1 Tax=Mycolicibacterium goodii TaxID=134601 RepID=UPI001BDD879C|nr:hypothetical protein [Mycolicibacterium goodii]MBU8820850.1 hypothetical protein [Mycolicibacterium goodii]
MEKWTHIHSPKGNGGRMKYLPAVMFSVLAALVGCIGGALQRSAGPGSQPGLVLTHIAAAIVMCAVIAAVFAWLSTDHSDTSAQKAYITASDGRTVIPMVGPYATESDAFADLPLAKAQFDAQSRFEWAVQIVAEETTLVGVGNDHFAHPSAARH